MSWRVARSLDTLLDEINTAAPDRSTLSDGSIGDPAHSSRLSDHNPNPAGVVRARDYTHDPAGGLDCNELATFLADLLGEHPALGPGSYIIWNRQIISRDRIDEGWRPYDGSNPHDKHLHLSVATAATGYDSTAPWGWKTEEDDMPLSDADKKWIRDTIRDELEAHDDLSEQLNAHSGKDDPFAGKSLRAVVKAIARKVGAV